MMKASRREAKRIFIDLDLGEADRFDVPSGITRRMTVHELTWEVYGRHGSLEAAAVDDDGCGWTLSLRMSDIPDEARAALIAACFEGDREGE